MLSNNGLSLYGMQYVLLFLVLVVNSDQFQSLQSYMLLLKPPVLVRSCCSCIVHKGGNTAPTTEGGRGEVVTTEMEEWGQCLQSLQTPFSSQETHENMLGHMYC